MKRTLSVLLSMFLVLSSALLDIHAAEIAVAIPSENDYSISNNIILGLKQDYINSLDETEKQNIKLVLPGVVGETAITGIADKAFSQYYKTGCRFIELDISQMSNLKTIGERAFYSNSSMKGNVCLPSTIESISNYAFEGCSSLSGDLILPDSLKTIGTYAFSGCKGMVGNLKLSSQLKVISNYAFKDAGFTGSLTIPFGVEKICESAFRQSNPYNGFSGKLIIPDSVKIVEKVSFSYQNFISDVQFSKNMTSIAESMFRYCKGLNGVLEIPDYIQSIGMNAFSETNLKTIYLPKVLDQESTTFIGDSPFYNCTYLTAIICKEQDYDYIKPLLVKYSSVQKKLTYETEIKLQDEMNHSYNSLLKLYNFSYQYVKQNDKSWKVDNLFQLPKVVGDNTGKWSVNQNSRQPIYETTIVGKEKVLYAIESYANPTINYSGNIDKVYDGLPARLSVDATHPKYVNIDDASQGDVVFYYTWKWSIIGGNDVIQQGFDLNTLDLTDVYNPTYPIACTVYLQACYVDNNKAIPFFTELHNFVVDIRQAESKVNPVYEKTVQYKDGFPDIKLSSNDTKGKILWDEGQVLKEGTHTYQWTFTPDSNQVGSSNYTVVKGSVEITALNPKIFNISIKDNGNGKVSPSYSYQVTQGNKTSLVITPNANYIVSSIKINGKESLSHLDNNVLVIDNVQSDYVIEIEFGKVDVNNVEHIIDELPKVDDNQELTKEQVSSILEAKLSYENLGSLKDSVSKETKKEFNELLMKLPQIKVESKSQVVDNSALLDNMSIEDVEILLNDPNATLSIECNMSAISDEKVEEEIKEYANDMVVSAYFDINIVKVLSTEGHDFQTTLSNLNTPVQLALELPKNLPSLDASYKREYYVIRIHEENGIKEVTILENESQDDSNIVISSDQFSVYAIAYKDIKLTDIPNDDSTGTKHPNDLIVTPIRPNQPTINVNKPDYSKDEINNSLHHNVKIQTNDVEDMSLWIGLCIVSLFVVIAFVVYKKKK